MTGTDGPARTGGGRCRWCLGPAAPGYARCYCCAVCRRVLGTPPVGVHPARYFRPGDPVHRMLRGYKDAPVAEARAACTRRLAALFEGWLDEGAARAGRWSMDSLAGRYEAHYRAVVGHRS